MFEDFWGNLWTANSKTNMSVTLNVTKRGTYEKPVTAIEKLVKKPSKLWFTGVKRIVPGKITKI